MQHACNGKQKLTHDRGIGIQNHEKIRTLGEKESYKYLRIFEVDTIK